MKRAALLVALVLSSPVAAEPIRIWGPPAMRGIVERWADAYRRTHPDTMFELTLKGSDTAIPGLYGGLADIALMGRENDIVDDNGFSRTMTHDFTRIEIANGSVSVPGKSDAIAVLANKANPIGGLSLAQLASVIDCGKPGAVATWGGLGLKGAWASRPVRIYSYDFGTRTGRYFQQVVTANGRRMCWDRITEFNDGRRFDGTVEDAADRAGAAGRRDPAALVIANPAQARGGLKLLPLDGVTPDESSIVSRRYLLARRVFAYVDRAPGEALKPDVAAFLGWVLGPEGQALVKADHGYLPLDPATASAQIAIIGETP